MTEKTKSCNLTEVEIKSLIQSYGCQLYDNHDEKLEHINYLNKRLKSFNDLEIKIEIPQQQQGWNTNG